ncbi:diaminopimelate decarboxylase [bacterium]|nr:diaminopimelate decarboxylase [bacterium]
MNWSRLEKKQRVLKRLAAAGDTFGSPSYIYDEVVIKQQCKKILRLSNAYGMTIRYAMKANPNRSILRMINNAGLSLDVSSINEAARAKIAGIPFNKMMLTSQDVPMGPALDQLHNMLQQGLRYTICSRVQLENLARFNNIAEFDTAIRIHHGGGSGESDSRNTSSPYASFGILVDDIPIIKKIMLKYGLECGCIHGHIGSGSEPEIWKQHVDTMLKIIAQHFPEAHTLNLGGGFKVARMPGEEEADIRLLGEYAESAFLRFNQNYGRKLKMEVEPGTFIIANAGMLLTRILDIKKNQGAQWTFIITDGGINANVRPLMYGSQHPFALLNVQGDLVWKEGDPMARPDQCIVVGRCCETGDCQTIDSSGRIIPRSMPIPKVGEYLLVGGVGAYSSTMSPFHYNSYLQPSEVLLTENGDLFQIRQRQSLEQVIANEWPVIAHPCTAA